MSAIIKIGANPGKLGINKKQQEFVYPTSNLMGLRVKLGTVIGVGGKADGVELTDKVIEANQQVLLMPAVQLKLVKYQTLLSVNPELLHYGMASYPTIVEPGEHQQVLVAFKAGRKFDASELTHLLTLYMID